MSQKSQSILTQGRCWLIVVCILWLCGCAEQPPAEIISYRGYEYVRLDVVQKAMAKKGISCWIEPKSK